MEKCRISPALLYESCVQAVPLLWFSLTPRLPTVHFKLVKYVDRDYLCIVLHFCSAFSPFVRETMTPGRVMASKSSKHHRTASSALGRRSIVLAAAAVGVLRFGGLPAANAEINHYNGMELPVSCCRSLLLFCLGLLSKKRCSSRRPIQKDSVFHLFLLFLLTIQQTLL